MNLNRRTLIKGIGAAGATLAFTGQATASTGRTRYVTKANGGDGFDGTEFEVLAEVSGDVVLVAGPDDAVEDLRNVDGVSIAVPDFGVELEVPETAESDATLSAEETYDDLLWDKQVQEVREAHGYATGAGRSVAVLDTGVDDTHQDLDVDVDRSVSVFDGGLTEHIGDTGTHGTHVAGTIAGTGDVSMTGTAPDATIVSVRILGEGSGTFGDILVGMEYAASIGADAANMSIGTSPIPPQANALQYRQLLESVANTVTRDGTLLVGSAGNSSAELGREGVFTLPNSLSGVVSVSSTAPNDELSFFSNYGKSEIDVGAPGGAYETLEKTYDPGTEWPFPLNLVYSTVPGGYDWKAGTSMAAPQVSGLAALVRELDESTNARQVESAIKHGAEGSSGRSDAETGAGRINALNTVEHVK